MKSLRSFFLNRKVQKTFIFLSFLCLVPMWLMLRRGMETLPAVVYVLGALAVVFFVLDRAFKPWENDRAEKRLKEQQEEEARAASCEDDES